jgi:hypothetical protein
VDSSRKNDEQNAQRNLAATDIEIGSDAKTLPKGAEKGSDFVFDNSAKSGTFSIETRL